MIKRSLPYFFQMRDIVKSGAFDMNAGDRVVYDIDGRRGVAIEFLQDGDAEVDFDDGTCQMVKKPATNPNSTVKKRRYCVIISGKSERFYEAVAWCEHNINSRDAWNFLIMSRRGFGLQIVIVHFYFEHKIDATKFRLFFPT